MFKSTTLDDDNGNELTPADKLMREEDMLYIKNIAKDEIEKIANEINSRFDNSKTDATYIIPEKYKINASISETLAREIIIGKIISVLQAKKYKVSYSPETVNQKSIKKMIISWSNNNYIAEFDKYRNIAKEFLGTNNA
jgi:hypothetical protein